MNLPEVQAKTHKPALRLPEGLFVVPNPNVEAPVVLHPKPELAPKPSGGDRETHTAGKNTGERILTSNTQIISGLINSVENHGLTKEICFTPLHKTFGRTRSILK